MAKQNKSPLVIIFLTVFIFLIGFGIAIPMIPMMGREFGASPTQIGLLLSVYSLMQFICAPFWGRLSDQKGRRPILLLCLAGEGLAYILFAFSRSLEMLFIARAVGGFFGGSLSTASAYISDVTPPAERSKGMGLIGAAFGLGFIIGPSLGGGLAWVGSQMSSDPYFPTTFASLWVSAFCFANFIFAYFLLKESLHSKVSAATASLKGRWTRLTEYYRRPVVGSLMRVFFLNALAMSVMEATLILLMADRFNWNLEKINLGFAYIGITSALAQGFLVRKLLPVYGERRLLLFGLACMVLSLASIAVCYDVYGMAVIMTLMSVGYSCTNPSILGSISVLTKQDEQGAVMGTTQSLSSLGRILGPAYGGFVYGRLSPSSPFVSGSIFALIALVHVFVLARAIPDAAKKAL